MSRYENTIVLNYRLTKKLGEGGFGTVFLAEHTELGRKAACKILHREFAEQPDVVDRFFREAKAVCAIGHKAIIDIENFGRLPDGEPFYLMEFFAGESLMDRARRRRMWLSEVTAVFGPVASALTAAHGKNIIHRDLKPENIMVLEEDGAITDVKLLDFGIAKLMHEGDSVRSRTNVAMGTPSYMPPEQARDAKSVDVRGDVYSFGATVYAAFAGRPPFVGDSVANVILKVQVDPPPPLASLAPHVPPALQTVLERCMAKNPAERPRSIAEAWKEIKAALATGGAAVADSNPALAVTMAPDASSQIPASSPALAGKPALATTLGSAVGQSVSPEPTKRRWLLPVAGLVVVGGGIAAFVGARSSGPGPIDAAQVATTPETSVPDVAAVVDVAPAVVDEAVDASVAIDAGVAVDAKPARIDAGIRLRPDAAIVVARDAGAAVKPDAAVPVDAAAPTIDCSLGQFDRVCEAANPSDADVQAAIRKLGQCRSKIANDKYNNLTRCFISK